MSYSSIASRCSCTSRRNRIPAKIRGCSVLTRPSSISGKPVYSATSSTGMPHCSRCRRVPPVLKIRTPARCKPSAKSAKPNLSLTLIRAFRIGTASDTAIFRGSERFFQQRKSPLCVRRKRAVVNGATPGTDRFPPPGELPDGAIDAIVGPVSVRSAIDRVAHSDRPSMPERSLGERSLGWLGPPPRLPPDGPANTWRRRRSPRHHPAAPPVARFDGGAIRRRLPPRSSPPVFPPPSLRAPRWASLRSGWSGGTLGRLASTARHRVATPARDRVARAVAGTARGTTRVAGRRRPAPATAVDRPPATLVPRRTVAPGLFGDRNDRRTAPQRHREACHAAANRPALPLRIAPHRPRWGSLAASLGGPPDRSWQSPLRLG